MTADVNQTAMEMYKGTTAIENSETNLFKQTKTAKNRYKW